MSEENVKVVRRVYEAVARRDTPAVLALYDPEVEWDDSGTPLGRIGGAGVYRGHEGMRTWFREWYEAWESLEDHVLEVIDAGEYVISVVKMHARGRSSGLDVAFDSSGVWTVRGGKVVRVVWFETRAEALTSIGLSA
jgi:ketosteroid isomerase-like protein